MYGCFIFLYKPLIRITFKHLNLHFLMQRRLRSWLCIIVQVSQQQQLCMHVQAKP